jgi:hypothetical protein
VNSQRLRNVEHGVITKIDLPSTFQPRSTVTCQPPPIATPTTASITSAPTTSSPTLEEVPHQYHTEENGHLSAAAEVSEDGDTEMTAEDSEDAASNDLNDEFDP